MLMVRIKIGTLLLFFLKELFTFLYHLFLGDRLKTKSDKNLERKTYENRKKKFKY